MADIETEQNRDENSPYPLPSHDRLKVLSSTRPVVTQSTHVRINHERLKELAQRWLQEIAATSDHTAEQDQWYFQYHFFDGGERTVNWMLLLDALNFCFWSERGQPRWTIEYKGETLNGYWAEAAALTRAVEEGLPLWDADYLSKLNSETLAHIFRGEQTIPLFEERLRNAREVGYVLQTHFNGQFSQVIAQAKGSAPALAELLTTYFPSFNDITTYRGQEVRFLKRAQICVSDLASAFKGTAWGAFSDLNQLTAFADYKLPQVLRHFHVFEYSDKLAQRIDTQMLLPAGSEEEVEIRAATVWACELLQRAMRQEGQENVTAAEIDQRLWLLGQDATTMRPYHRTRTIFY
ncbi:queuosine 5'-phosphate N-glycosylase/hydrolase [Ktedonospora formicarum]|uniref:Queuosine 5'-phosphate N-glycosylase/hydrolase n=1 Tax=Ktedonospora formicarum TaxID=2778364 RepID=A0A8J3I4P9_9CHLR|nr:queuosine salvage family protein [Ktedonospora formicarum]GHO50207.1 hypothetical protein KSX_83700 [Ktedonospora formicarum]